MEHVVIVGAGQAGVQTADSLRREGFTGAVTLLGAERSLPYQRPPLSKDYLLPNHSGDPLPLRGPSFYAEQRIDLRGGVAVTAIDLRQRTVTLDTGEPLPYSVLVLATGAANRRVAVDGADLAGIHDLRTVADAERLRLAMREARSVVVIGAGFIGLEFAAAARAHGLPVTVLEAGQRPMSRSISPAMSRRFAAAHREMGTDLKCGEALSGFAGQRGRLTSVMSTSGAAYPCDLAVVAIGVNPRDGLAASAGLRVRDGVVVDHDLRASDSAVYAIGDCARFPAAPADELIRLESVQNATDQGRRVARTIVGTGTGDHEPPWFWSSQGSLRLQIAGLAAGADRHLLVGDVSHARFSVFCFRGERLVAVESVNRPADHIAARHALASGRTPTPAEVIDPGFTLKSFSQRAVSAV